MKSFLLLPLLAALATGQVTQYHSQDELGQASYGYAHPGQAHSATRDAGGRVRGTYAYASPDGSTVQVNYIADEFGYRAASNALPVAPVHYAAAAPVAVAAAPVAVAAAPVAVAAAPVAHYAAAAPAVAYAAAPLIAGHPGPIPDTPEVVAARIQHAAAHAQALARAGRKKRQVVAYGAPLAYSAAPVAYATHAVRPAILTRVVNNPGHAVSYRVD